MPQNCDAEIAAALGRADLSASEKAAIKRHAAKLQGQIAGGSDSRVVIQKFLDDRTAAISNRKIVAAGDEMALAGLRARASAAGDFALRAPGEFLKSLNISSLKQFEGSRSSLGHYITHGTADAQNDFLTDLRSSKLSEYAFAPENQKPIFKAFYALQGGKDASEFGSNASKAAAIFKKHTDAMWGQKKGAYIPVGKIEDWAGPQHHDPYQLATAGKNPYGSAKSADVWVKDAMKWTDWQRTMGGEFAAADDSLRAKRAKEQWVQFTSAHHLEYDGLDDPAKNREWHFKDADAAHEYNMKYGNGRSLAENITSWLSRGARDVQISKMYGSNPEGAFKTIANELGRKVEDDETMPLDQKKRAMDGLKAELHNGVNKWLPAYTGALANPEHAGVAQYIASARAATNAIAVAGSTLRMIGDIPLMMRLLSENGGRSMGGFMSRLAKSVGWMANLPKEQRIRMAQAGGIMMQDLTRPLTHSHQDFVGFGVVNKLEQNMMRLSGHTPLTDRFHTNMLAAYGRDMWEDRGRPLEQLTDGQQRVMQRFGITGPEWDVIRKQEALEHNGGGILTPRGVRQMDLENFKPLTPTDSDGSLRRTRDAVADKFRNLLGEISYRGSSAPDAEMSALVRQGSKDGTFWGEVRNQAAALKGWSFNLLRNHYGEIVMGDSNPDNVGWGRALANFAKGKGGLPGGRVKMAKFIANNVLFGMLIDQLYQMRDGRSPQIPQTQGDAASALLRGFVAQGAGPYADLVSSQLNHPDQSVFDTIGRSMSPLTGDTADVIQAAGRVVAQHNSAAVKKSEEQMANMLYRTTPGNDLVYTKWATDYFLKDSLMEAINPGYKERLNARVQKNGQTLLLGPH